MLSQPMLPRITTEVDVHSDMPNNNRTLQQQTDLMSDNDSNMSVHDP